MKYEIKHARSFSSLQVQNILARTTMSETWKKTLLRLYQKLKLLEELVIDNC